MKATAKARLIRCESGAPGAVRILSDRIQLQEGQARSVETLTRIFSMRDPYYGKIEITRPMLLSMVSNFKAGVYGQDILIDVSHQPSKGAAGTVRRLFVEGQKLRAEIDWTDYGIDAVAKRGFRYFSADYHENYEDPESGKEHGATLLGAGLTTRPRVKRLDPVSLKLSFDDEEDDRYLVSPRVEKLLTEEIQAMWKELLDKLKRALSETHKLGEDLVKQLASGFEDAVKGVTDEAQAKLLMEAFANTGKQLAEQMKSTPGAQAIKLDFSGLNLPAGGVSRDDLTKLLDERETERNTKRQESETRRAANVKIFTDVIEGAEGLKQLSEATRKQLLGAADLITAEMSDDQVRRLAEHQVAIGNQLAVSTQLSAMGWQGGQGSPRITMDDSNSIKKLQETVDLRLSLADMPESRRFANTGGKLQPENKRLAEAVLAAFDREHGARLAAEHKMLAGGDGIVSDVAVPVVWERTVIREALYRLVGLQFVAAGSEQFATSYSIPYSYRDTAAAGLSSTRKYEGQSIARAGVIQTAETAYNIPQKLAFEVSDELRYLTAARHLNWEAVSENQGNASRIIGEDLDQLIFNEVLHAADEYGAVAVTNEDLGPQTDGTDNVVLLANFPVVRPRAVYDLQGNQVGSTTNPITVTYNSVALSEYDGTGTQAAGTYYVLDYNLGEIYLVDETGAIVTPGAAIAFTISYSYATNVYAFDTDPGAVAVDAHWDTFLYRYGLRKSIIEDDRYHMANYGLMSGTVMTQVEQAKQFGANAKRPGTDLAADGNLGRVKDVPNFKTSAPGLWMGDQRILIAERGITRLRMTKAWTLGELENQKDANGRFTGKKEAYGDQFVVLHTPTQLKRAGTSLVLYSGAARVARVTP